MARLASISVDRLGPHHTIEHNNRVHVTTLTKQSVRTLTSHLRPSELNGDHFIRWFGQGRRTPPSHEVYSVYRHFLMRSAFHASRVRRSPRA